MMLRIKLILLIAGLLPFSVFADTTLYVCSNKGQTILESTPDKDCEKITEYRYPTYDHRKKSDNAAQDKGPYPTLRPGERNALQRLNRAQQMQQQQAYAPRGDAGACAYYTYIYNDAAAVVAVKDAQRIEIGPVRWAELSNQMGYAQAQMHYACP
jgi:hypothetical protein